MKNLLSLVIGIFTSIHVFAGGISSGGGGTLPADPVNARKIHEIITNAKLDLRLFLKYELWGYSGSSYSYNKKIYGGPQTIFDVLESTNIEILMDKPCRDANGVEVDGSIHASKPNTICISAFSTAPKLVEERARKEILALILHELSHLLGTDEDEADDFQKTALYHLRKTYDETGIDLVKNSSLELQRATMYLQSTIRKFDALTNDEIAEQLKKVNEYLLEFHRINLKLPYSVFDKKERSFDNIQSNGRFLLALWHGLRNSSAHDAAYWGQQYDEVFASKNKVTYEEYYNGKHSSLKYDEDFGDYELNRITDKDQFKSELQGVLTYLDAVADYLGRLQLSLALEPLPTPDVTGASNPWSEFIGEYVVEGTLCAKNGLPDNSNNLQKFAVFMQSTPEGQKPYMKREWPSSRAEDGVYNGAADVLSGSAVTVSGNSHCAHKVGEAENSKDSGVTTSKSNKCAQRVADFGTNWGEEWQKTTFVIEELDGQFQLYQKTIWQKRYHHKPTKTEESECVFDLRKI